MATLQQMMALRAARMVKLKMDLENGRPKPKGWYRNIVSGQRQYFAENSAPYGWIYEFSSINEDFSKAIVRKIDKLPKRNNLFANKGYVRSPFSDRYVKYTRTAPVKSNWNYGLKGSAGFSSGTFGYETRILGSKLGGELKIAKLDVLKIELGYDSDNGWALFDRVYDDTYENGLSAGNIFGGSWNNEVTIDRKIISNTVSFNLYIATLSFTSNDKENIYTISGDLSASYGFIMGGFAGINGYVSYRSIKPRRWSYDEMVNYCNNTGTPPPWPFPKVHPGAGFRQLIENLKTKK